MSTISTTYGISESSSATHNFACTLPGSGRGPMKPRSISLELLRSSVHPRSKDYRLPHVSIYALLYDMA